MGNLPPLKKYKFNFKNKKNNGDLPKTQYSTLINNNILRLK